ncbi:MAG: hypothetical protein HOV80_17705 [Polyangiaceae bacterium]|nr:hypothetical protein [Polyangiaceae bacterium]
MTTKRKPRITHDPDTYAACSRPRPVDTAVKAMDAFSTELDALRLKHGIANLYAVIEVNVEEDGTVSARRGLHSRGSSDRAIELAAFGFAYEKAKHDRRVAHSLTRGAELSAADEEPLATGPAAPAKDEGA